MAEAHIYSMGEENFNLAVEIGNLQEPPVKVTEVSRLQEPGCPLWVYATIESPNMTFWNELRRDQA